jgi:hypothetical protein
MEKTEAAMKQALAMEGDARLIEQLQEEIARLHKQLKGLEKKHMEIGERMREEHRSLEEQLDKANT